MCISAAFGIRIVILCQFETLPCFSIELASEIVSPHRGAFCPNVSQTCFLPKLGLPAIHRQAIFCSGLASKVTLNGLFAFVELSGIAAISVIPANLWSYEETDSNETL